MLISFKIKNFRSFKNDAELNLETKIRKGSSDNIPIFTKLIETKKETLKLLNSAFIYGYNGTGKSSFIYAAKTLKELLVNSWDDNKKDLLETLYEPFLFSKEKNGNTTFQIKRAMREKETELFSIYYYKIVFNSTLIIEEEISVDDKNIPLLDPNPQRKDIPVLTKLAKKGDKIFSKIYEFLTENLTVTNHRGFFEKAMKEFYKEDMEFKNRLNNKIKKAGIGIDGLSFTSKEFNINELSLPEKLKKKLMEEHKDGLITLGNETSIHSVQGKEYQLEIKNESMGTRSFISILYVLYRAIKHNKISFFDEVFSFLHPALIREIINIVKESNFGGQMILSTHDIYMLNHIELRRDQIRITSKNKNQESELKRVIEFEKRTEINIAKNMMEGKYGSIPEELCY